MSDWRSEYTSFAFDKLRYADTDRQGHVNNALFNVFLETGRVEFLYAGSQGPLHADDGEFVIVSLELQLEGEIRWPGRVDIGTRVARVGKSSITLEQGIFQDDRRTATAKTVIVHIDSNKRSSSPLPEATAAQLKKMAGPAET